MTTLKLLREFSMRTTTLPNNTGHIIDWAGGQGKPTGRYYSKHHPTQKDLFKASDMKSLKDAMGESIIRKAVDAIGLDEPGTPYSKIAKNIGSETVQGVKDVPKTIKDIVKRIKSPLGYSEKEINNRNK